MISENSMFKSTMQNSPVTWLPGQAGMTTASLLSNQSRFSVFFFFFSSRRRHTRYIGDWSSDVCSSDLRALLVERIADLVNQRTPGFTDITGVRDESDENTRVVVEIKRDAIPKVVINNLYKFTQLETSFAVNMRSEERRVGKECRSRRSQ